MEISNAFVCLMGLGVVFFGLICIILLCMLMSAICRKFDKSAEAPTVIESVPTEIKTTITNRQEFIAAVSAAIAEDLGKDISALRILSVKEL